MQLAKFGLHNGPTDDDNNLYENGRRYFGPRPRFGAPNDYFCLSATTTTPSAKRAPDGIACASPSKWRTTRSSFRLTLPGRIQRLSRAQPVRRQRTSSGSWSPPAAEVAVDRGVGPTLLGFGVPALADPVLALFNATGSRSSPTTTGVSSRPADSAATITAGAFPEDGSDSALLVMLDESLQRASQWSAGRRPQPAGDLRGVNSTGRARFSGSNPRKAGQQVTPCVTLESGD